jgi:hypothetical protein
MVVNVCMSYARYAHWLNPNTRVSLGRVSCVMLKKPHAPSRTYHPSQTRGSRNGGDVHLQHTNLLR